MDQKFSITPADLSGYAAAFDASRTNAVAMNAVVNSGLLKPARNPAAVQQDTHVFSVNLQQGDVTSQKQSGRCWMFAALNVLRSRLIRERNLKNFEFSQSYLFFWDKLEKSNYFLESILETMDEPVEGRLMSFLLQAPVNDGGQWDMLCGLVKKYGLVPQSAYPETVLSSASRELNSVLTEKLREYACILRKKHASGEAAEDLRSAKSAMMAEVYRILCICLGKPPKTFDFEYRDKDSNFHRDCGLTPLSFYEKYVGVDLEEYVSLINAPTKDKPYGKTYTVKYLGNVVEGHIKYLNLPMEQLKELVVKQMQAGELVWFGSDCGKFGDRDSRFWDDQSFDSLPATGLDVAMTKEEMLDCCDSAMNHAMCFTGVNIGEDGKPNRWKIENSWGSEGLNEGYYMASDSWFDLLVYQAVVHKKYLGDKAAILDTDPIVLDPWDPIGSLAD